MLFKSLQVGTVKIEWQDVRAATEKVVAALSHPAQESLPKSHSTIESPALPSTTRGDSILLLEALAAEAPALALVGLRIEIERRLRAIAHATGLPASSSSAGILLRQLVSSGQMSETTANGLQELLALGNTAAHGASVTPAAASWSLDMAPAILDDLDKRLACASCHHPITLDDEVAIDELGKYHHKVCIRARPAT